MESVEGISIHAKGFCKLVVLKQHSIQNSINPVITSCIDPESPKVVVVPLNCCHCKGESQLIIIPSPFEGPFSSLKVCLFLLKLNSGIYKSAER
jgi:hypothetical protein